MKLSLKSMVAAAVLTVASAVANAAPPVVPPQPATGPIPLPSSQNSGVIVSIWDTTKSISLTVYLGLSYADIVPANMTPDAGLVLDFGTLTGFATTFAHSNQSDLVYSVFATKGAGPATGQTVLTTGPTDAFGLGAVNNGNITQVISAANSFFGQLNTACGATVPCVSDGTVNPTINTAAFAGQLSWGSRYNGGLSQADASGAVGTALDFYSLQKSGSTATLAANVTRFQNGAGAGQWLLTTSGGLTYSIGAVSAVPVPAALWLLLSGFGGLATIGRRRSAAV